MIHMQRLDLRIRPMVEADAEFIVPLGVTPEDFLYWLYQPGVVTVVSEQRYDQEPVAFGVFSLGRYNVSIEGIAVLPKYRRSGVATHMIGMLKAKAKREGCKRITVNVRDNRLDMQLFLKQAGFQAVNTFKNADGEEMWHFVHKVK